MENVIFVTGTNTGAGKTLVTCLLLARLRQRGLDAVAMKPFSSGRRTDLRALQTFQPGVLSDEQVNPYHFSRPLAPLLAGRSEGRGVRLGSVVKAISRMAAGRDTVLVEGVGGIMVPLGDGYGVSDLVGELGCGVVVVGRNQLGVINDMLLTVGEARRRTAKGVRVVLRGVRSGGGAAETNAGLLRELLVGTVVEELPFLGGGGGLKSRVEENARKLKKVLDRICG